MDSRGSVRSGVVCFGCCWLLFAKGVKAALRSLRLFVGGGGAFWREEEDATPSLATMMKSTQKKRLTCITSNSLEQSYYLSLDPQSRVDSRPVKIAHENPVNLTHQKTCAKFLHVAPGAYCSHAHYHS